MIKGTLTKISDNENELRTDSVEGVAPHPPTVGQSFIVLSGALDPVYDYRAVTTSHIVEIEGNEFKTHNSTYRWEPIK